MKRKTLNPVVSPERKVGLAQALAMDAGNRDRIAKTRDGSHPGVADGIEQQGMTEHEPGALGVLAG